MWRGRNNLRGIVYIASIALVMGWLQGCSKKPVESTEPHAEVINATDLSRITVDNKLKAFPSINGDGTKLLYQVIDNDRKNKTRWYVVQRDLDSVGTTQIAGPNSIQPVWNSAGNGFIYQDAAKGILMRGILGGAAKTFVSQRPYGSGNDSYPDMNSDNSRIVFNARFDGEEKICFVNTNGTSLEISTGGIMPQWSPDGDRVVFQRRIKGRNQIMVLTVKSGEVVQLTEGMDNNTSPTWSSDGQRIAFNSDRPDATSEDKNQNHLFIMENDGTGVQQMTSGKRDSDSRASWSKDGYIYFVSGETDDDSDIWRLRPTLD